MHGDQPFPHLHGLKYSLGISAQIGTGPAIVSEGFPDHFQRSSFLKFCRTNSIHPRPISGMPSTPMQKHDQDEDQRFPLFSFFFCCCCLFVCFCATHPSFTLPQNKRVYTFRNNFQQSSYHTQTLSAIGDRTLELHTRDSTT